MQLPADVAAACKPVFDLLPLDAAMPALVVDGSHTAHPGDHAALCAAIDAATHAPALQNNPALAAGLWLYADELDRSHTLSQSIGSRTGSFWHGIMHRREGDFSNSKYWFRNTGDHPALQRIAADSAGIINASGFDPFDFIDQVAQAQSQDDPNPPTLVVLQRREWLTLFEHSATH